MYKNIPDNLVDIKDISVDQNLSKRERIEEYLRQIKDPYHFRCGKFIVTAKFASEGPTIEECLHGLFI